MKKMKKKQRNALMRKMIVLIQLITLLGLTGAILMNQLLPVKYLAVIAGGLFGLWLICFGMQFLKSKVHLAGIVLSILLSVAQFTGMFYVDMANDLLDKVGGAEYKIDNMVVVVKVDDPAQSIQDAAGYMFGVHDIADNGNTDQMLVRIEEEMAEPVSTEKYGAIQEVAWALLDDEVQAAIYNEAYVPMIEEEIEDYSSMVRVLYQYEIETEIEKEEADITEGFNVYISGIDVAGSISKNSRSDVNIIMTVNPETKKILLTTTPRDYYVEIPGISGGQKDKLTHAGIYGVDASMRTLEELYGIDISYYARVNFTSLVRIVDALGGIDVESEYSFSAGGYNFTEGTNHLNGEAALAFSRERKSFASGDRQRGKNQEAVIEGILAKAMSPAVLKNANEIIASVSDCVETNMTKKEMTEFISMQLSDSANWNIESLAADGSGSSQSCYSSGSQKLYVMIPDETVVEDIRQRMQEVLETVE